MAEIAILGFGTVGSGVYEVLCRNAAGVSRRAGEPVEVKYILTRRIFRVTRLQTCSSRASTPSCRTRRSGR